VNPIEKAERSTLIVATTIHQLPSEELVRPDQIAKVAEFSPLLFDSAGSQDASSTPKLLDAPSLEGIISQKSTKVAVY
jgi:hypothetical protein